MAPARKGKGAEQPSSAGFEALTSRGERFASEVIAGIADPFVVQDASWRFTLVNPAAARVFEQTGNTPRGLLGKVVWDVYPQIVGTAFEREMRRAMEQRVPVTFEAFYPERGEWSQLHCYPLADGSLATQWRDITERRKAEEASAYLARATEILASSLEQDTTLSQLAHMVVPELADWCVVDARTPEGGLKRLAVAHKDPKMVAFARDLETKYPSDPNAPTGMPNVLRTGKPELYADIPPEMIAAGARDAEHARILRELDLRSVMIVPIIARGVVHGALSMVSTESRRRYTETDLRLALELGRRAGLAIDNALLLAEARASADRTARLQSVTARLAAIVTPEEASDTVLSEAVAAFDAHSGVLCLLSEDETALEIVAQHGLPQDAATAYRSFPVNAPLPMSEAVRENTPLFLETKADIVARYPALREENARAETVAWIALPLESGGRVIGGIALGFATARSFSSADRAFATALSQQAAQAIERTRLYAAERTARTEAEIANRAKSDFLATMSHELRTPLNAIGGYAELLEIGVHGTLSDTQREVVQRISRSERHLRGLIEDVLSFARIEAGHVEARMGIVRVLSVVQDVEAIVLPRLQARRQVFRFTNCDDALRAYADADKVKQVLVNLVMNAVKFSSDGTTIELVGEETDGEVVVTVTDEGIGIPEEKLQVIFDPFVQLGRSLTNLQEGSGLGLAISRDLARAMGGDIHVRSRLGEGSSFVLTLQRPPGSTAA